MISFWQQEAFLQPADVVIAGAGFMGLWCAYELKRRQPTLRITVLEKSGFPGGASVRNAGFACFGSPGEMLSDVAAMGEQQMWQTVEMRYKGIQKLRTVLQDEAIDYDACGGYECFSDESHFQPVQEQLEWLNKGIQAITGVPAAFSIADENISKLGLKNFNHLIVNQLEGGLHSGKTIQALLQIVIGLGVTVLFGTEVTQWEQTAHGIRIVLQEKEPLEITTKQLIITTNAFIPQLVNTFTVQPTRGQVLVTQPIEGLPLKGTFHFDEGFYYWRNVGNRILLGGARNKAFAAENTTAQCITPIIQQALEDFLHAHINLPHTSLRIDLRWAGIMGFTEQKQPLIYQPANNVLAAVGCNGMGVALAPVIAEKIAAAVLD